MSKLPRHQIAAVLAERSMSSVNAEQLGEEIAAYLLDERRTADLESLLRDIMQYRIDHGIVEVIAVSVNPLTDEVRKNIEAEVRELFPNSETVIISEELQPDVVGGVRLEFPNQQLDLSVRAKLNHFKQLTTPGRK